MKSAGPKIIVWTRGAAFAIASIAEQTLGVLDLRLDTDPADLEAHRLLDLGEQDVQRDDLVGGLHLRQHDAVEIRAGTLDDLDHVAVRPVRRPVVHPHHADLAAPPALVERGDDVLAGFRLGQRSTGVLEVQEHLIGVETLRLLQEAGIASRNCQTGTARAKRFGHVSSMPNHRPDDKHVSDGSHGERSPFGDYPSGVIGDPREHRDARLHRAAGGHRRLRPQRRSARPGSRRGDCISCRPAAAAPARPRRRTPAAAPDLRPDGTGHPHRARRRSCSRRAR